MFDTSITSQAAEQQVTSPVTAGSSADTLALATPLVQTGVKVGMAFHQKGKLDKELGSVHEGLQGLDRQFSNIQEAIKSGQNRRGLEMRARAALKAAVGSSPLLKDYAEGLYSQYFGGASPSSTGTSGGTSAFKLSPEEEQAEKIQMELADLTLAGGYSEEQALGIIQSKRAGQVAKQELERLETESKVNMYQVQPLFDAAVTDWNVNFNVQLQTTMQANGGFLPQDTKVNFAREIDAQLIRQRRQLEKVVKDPRTGMYTVPVSEVTRMLGELDQQAANQKALLEDNSYQKFINDRQLIKNNEAAVTAMELLPQVTVLRKAGGDQFAAEWLNYSMRDNSKARAWLEAVNPEFASIMNMKPAMHNSIAVKGAAALFGGTGDMPTRPLTPTESLVIGDSISSNYALAVGVLERAKGGLGKVTETMPEALASTYSPKTQNIRDKKATTFKENIQDLQNGAINNVITQFRSEFGQMPHGLRVTAEMENPRTSGARPYVNVERALTRPASIRVTSDSGLRIPQEMANVVADLYRSVASNPTAVPDVLKGMKPEEVVSIWINSGQDIRNIPEPQMAMLVEELGYSYTTRDPGKSRASGGSDKLSRTADMLTEPVLDAFGDEVPREVQEREGLR